MSHKSMEQKFLESEIETYKHLYEIYKQQEETYRTNYFEIMKSYMELTEAYNQLRKRTSQKQKSKLATNYQNIDPQALMKRKL